MMADNGQRPTLRADNPPSRYQRQLEAIYQAVQRAKRRKALREKRSA